MEFGHAVFERVLRQGPKKAIETILDRNPPRKSKKTWSKMGTAAVAYIALLASRLPWYLGGAAPAAAGAGSQRIYKKIIYRDFIALLKPCSLLKLYNLTNEKTSAKQMLAPCSKMVFKSI